MAGMQSQIYYGLETDRPRFSPAGRSMTSLHANPHAATTPGSAEGSRSHVSPSLLRLARGLFAGTSDCIVLLAVRDDGHVVCQRLNPAAERLLGRTAGECENRPVRDWLPPAEAEQLESHCRDCASSGRAVNYE